MELLNMLTNIDHVTSDKPAAAKLWLPKRVVFTPDALAEPYGQLIYNNVKKLNLETEILANNRITGLRGTTERETYKIAKSTLAIVKAPPSAFNLRPIPPSADYQFHLAEGCPAHCQYCYLAGSLQGPPAIRVFANLPQILSNTIRYQDPNKITSFEASCYTDPLSLEHITGGLKEAIQFFGSQPNSHLRFVTKFDAVESLLNIEHNGHTRYRCSLNAETISKRLEGGTANTAARIAALRKMAMPKLSGGGGYPVGIVLAPIIPIDDWKISYSKLLSDVKQNLNFDCDLTFELITHRFTAGSKDVLMEWYPNTSLDMTEDNRSVKMNKFGAKKYVYKKEIMNELKSFFAAEISNKFPAAKILYWT